MYIGTYDMDLTRPSPRKLCVLEMYYALKIGLASCFAFLLLCHIYRYHRIIIIYLVNLNFGEPLIDLVIFNKQS